MRTENTRAGGASTTLSGGGVATVVICTCALVATAAWLGMNWLRTPALGVPAGVWLIAACAAIACIRPPLRRWCVARADRPQRSSAMAIASRAVTEVILDMAAWCTAGFIKLAEPVCRAVGLAGADGIEEAMCRWHDACPWPVRPVRIGVDAFPGLCRALFDVEGDEDIQWVPIRLAGDEQVLCRRARLDAIVRQESDLTIRVITAVRAGRPAGIEDWSRPTGASYPAVFPFRVDPASVTLELPEHLDRAGAALARAVIESAAALARVRGRLGLTDRVAGRRPLGAEATDTADRCMLRLAERIDGPGSADADQVAQLAARACSAWLSTWTGRLPGRARRRCLEAAARIMPDEPAVHLRLAAVQIASLDDDAALVTLRRAHDLIRRQRRVTMVDPVAYLLSELEHGPAGALTLGRIAAGVCLAFATTDDAGVAFLREDLIEDIRGSHWLIGRDQDQRLLIEVFHALQQTRQTEVHATAAAA